MNGGGFRHFDGIAAAFLTVKGDQHAGGDGTVGLESKGLKQISDTGALEGIIDEVLAANQKSVDEFRAGKQKAFNALVGQCMKATRGKANPAQVNELLRKKLGA